MTTPALQKEFGVFLEQVCQTLRSTSPSRIDRHQVMKRQYTFVKNGLETFGPHLLELSCFADRYTGKNLGRCLFEMGERWRDSTDSQPSLFWLFAQKGGDPSATDAWGNIPSIDAWGDIEFNSVERVDAVAGLGVDLAQGYLDRGGFSILSLKYPDGQKESPELLAAIRRGVSQSLNRLSPELREKRLNLLAPSVEHLHTLWFESLRNHHAMSQALPESLDDIKTPRPRL